jgi:hypothetical protein
VPKAAPAKISPLLAALPPEKLLAVELVKALYFQWKEPMEALTKAGRAFEGLEALLGGSGFELQGNIWRRQVRRISGSSTTKSSGSVTSDGVGLKEANNRLLLRCPMVWLSFSWLSEYSWTTAVLYLLEMPFLPGRR